MLNRQLSTERLSMVRITSQPSGIDTIIVTMMGEGPSGASRKQLRPANLGALNAFTVGPSGNLQLLPGSPLAGGRGLFTWNL